VCFLGATLDRDGGAVSTDVSQPPRKLIRLPALRKGERLFSINYRIKLHNPNPRIWCLVCLRSWLDRKIGGGSAKYKLDRPSDCLPSRP
jgi:hypothetical protein